MSNNKLSFFENIYYWMWYYIPKLGYTISPPSELACFLVSIFKIINILWILILINSIVNKNLEKAVFGDNVLLMFLIGLALALFLLKIDEKKYKKKLDIISAKVEELSSKEKNIKRLIFFVYILISLGVWGFASMLVAQS